MQNRPNYEPDSRCARCDRKLMVAPKWRALPQDEKRRLHHLGWDRKESRGLCARCYAAVKRRGQLDEWALDPNRAQIIREEYDFLADHCRPLAENVRNLAPRLGVTESVMRQALRGYERGAA